MPFFTWPFRAQSNQNYNLWYVKANKNNEILITTWTGSILIKQLNSLVLDKDEVVTVSEEDDLNEDENKSKVKSAKAITDLMLGLMDFKIGKFRWKNDEKKIIYHRVVDITYRYIKEKII